MPDHKDCVAQASPADHSFQDYDVSTKTALVLHSMVK